MFEGLLAPWHLLILVAVVFVVVGPRKLHQRWHSTAEQLRRWAEDDPADPDVEAHPSEPKRSYPYRFARRLRGRR